MGIRYSTAKTILKVFKCEGRIEKKKKRTKKGSAKCDSEPRSLPVPMELGMGQDQMSGFSLSPVAGLLKRDLFGEKQFLLKNYGFGLPLPDNFWASKITAHLLREDVSVPLSPQKLVS